MKKKSFFWAITTSILITISCKKEPQAINEEELISTLIISLKKNSSLSIQNYIWNDTDGIGGIDATVDSIIIDKDAEYNASILLLNTHKTPTDTISNEVLEEGTTHQFFYQSTPASALSNFQYQTPNDADGNPIGINFRFETIDASNTGFLKIILRHQPNKLGSGVSSGDITNAQGETDIEIEFPFRIQ